MDKRTTDIVCYCTWVGLLVAVLAGNREASRFHLNQSLVLGIFGLLGVIPCVGWVWAVFVYNWIIALQNKVFNRRGSKLF